MFGLKREMPWRLVPFTEAMPHTFSALLCDGVTAHNVQSFADLLALHAKFQQERPDVRVLASLDDLGQASYTSGHSIDFHELDGIAGDDLVEESEGFEDGTADFPTRLANLNRLASTVGLGQVTGVLDWGTPGDANDLVTINSDPDAALRIRSEKEVLFQFVPVRSAADAIAAFPNGYFNADLNPMQNHVLARHLETRYGLNLFGIGSRFIGFTRETSFEEDVARRLATELAGLYAGAPGSAASELAAVITGKKWLLVRYAES